MGRKKGTTADKDADVSDGSKQLESLFVGFKGKEPAVAGMNKR